MPLVACKLTPQRCDFGNSERSTCLRRELAGCGEPDRGRKRQKHTEVVEGETEQVGPAKESTRSGTWGPYRTPVRPKRNEGIHVESLSRRIFTAIRPLRSWRSTAGIRVEAFRLHARSAPLQVIAL